MPDILVYFFHEHIPACRWVEAATVDTARGAAALAWSVEPLIYRTVHEHTPYDGLRGAGWALDVALRLVWAGSPGLVDVATPDWRVLGPDQLRRQFDMVARRACRDHLLVRFTYRRAHVPCYLVHSGGGNVYVLDMAARPGASGVRGGAGGSQQQQQQQQQQPGTSGGGGGGGRGGGGGEKKHDRQGNRKRPVTSREQRERLLSEVHENTKILMPQIPVPGGETTPRIGLATPPTTTAKTSSKPILPLHTTTTFTYLSKLPAVPQSSLAITPLASQTAARPATPKLDAGATATVEDAAPLGITDRLSKNTQNLHAILCVAGEGSEGETSGSSVESAATPTDGASTPASSSSDAGATHASSPLHSGLLPGKAHLQGRNGVDRPVVSDSLLP
ncbi:hypothetical protein F4780DRAFT_793803 [Xylariomycetidae sp. FL0641]|nr:hypothetical protein F4780DRAFT_793803 [Xylariomycetidae sp. FL0641]